jgi:hypothetical protein
MKVVISKYGCKIMYCVPVKFEVLTVSHLGCYAVSFSK